MYIEVVQDGTGSRTLTFPVNTKITGGVSGTTPTLATAAGAVNLVRVIYDGTNFIVTP